MHKDLAEVTGALIGDGCLSKYWSKSEKLWRYEVAFTGNKNEYSYYSDFVQPVIKNEFGQKGYLYKRKDGYTRYHIKSKKVFSYFKSLQIPIGKKSTKLTIPTGIIKNQKLAIACLRGIMDTDGSIYRRYNKKYNKHSKIYDYQVIQLKMKSKKVIEQARKVLAKTGIKSNKITENGGCYLTRVTSQKDVKIFIEKIGFRNEEKRRKAEAFLRKPY